FSRDLLRKRPGQHELGLEDGAGLLNHSVEGRRYPADHWVLDPLLHLRNDVPGIALEPMSIEGLGHEAKLDDEIVGEVLRLGLAAFLAPQPQQGSLVAPHDDPSGRTSDEAPAIKAFRGDPCGLEREGHDALQFSCSRISSAALRITPSASADKSRSRLSK